MKNNQREFQYKIKKISSKNFIYNELLEEASETLSGIYSLGIHSNMQLKKEDSTLSINYDIILKHNERKEIFIKHCSSTVYELKDIEDIFNEETDELEIPEDLLTVFYAIAYSHARALLSVELNKTNFKDKLYLPIMDPKKFIPK